MASATPFDPSALPTYHAAWRVGELTEDMLRDNLDWIYQAHGVAEHRDLALEMFAATGPLTDSPDDEMPSRITIYRGQVDGGPIGLSWTPWYDRAEFFGRRWADALTAAGQPTTYSVLTGVVRRRDVLLWSRSACEVVVDPGDVLPAPRDATADVGPVWAATTAEQSVEAGRSQWERQKRLLVSLMVSPVASAALVEAVSADYMLFCQAHAMGVI